MKGAFTGQRTGSLRSFSSIPLRSSSPRFSEPTQIKSVVEGFDGPVSRLPIREVQSRICKLHNSARTLASSIGVANCRHSCCNVSREILSGFARNSSAISLKSRASRRDDQLFGAGMPACHPRQAGATCSRRLSELPSKLRAPDSHACAAPCQIGPVSSG